MTQNVTDKLYESTKDAHTSVDKHPFVSLIRKDKRAGEMSFILKLNAKMRLVVDKT